MDIQQAVEQRKQDNEGVVVPLTGRDGEPDLDSTGTQATVTVVGEYAEKIALAQDSQTRKMWKRRAGTFDPATLTRKNRIEAAAAGVVAWTGVEEGGEPLPCTPENVIRLLTAAPWVLKQVEAAIESPSSFFAKR